MEREKYSSDFYTDQHISYCECKGVRTKAYEKNSHKESSTEILQLALNYERHSSKLNVI